MRNAPTSAAASTGARTRAPSIGRDRTVALLFSLMSHLRVPLDTRAAARAGSSGANPRSRGMNVAFERTRSLWMTETALEAPAALDRDTDADVVVVGGGIAGL